MIDLVFSKGLFFWQTKTSEKRIKGLNSMKNKVIRVLLSSVLGCMLLPVGAKTPVEGAKTQQKKEVITAVDDAVITYKKVKQLPAGQVDAVISFSNQESAQDLKNQFASASSHKKVAQSIIPGIKNLLFLVTGWLAELNAASAKELSKTVSIELKDPSESVVVTVVLSKVATAETQKIQATVTYFGLLTEEPAYMTNMLRAVFIRDAGSSPLCTALGVIAAGAVVVSASSRAVNGSWNPFYSETETETDSIYGLLKEELKKDAELLVFHQKKTHTQQDFEGLLNQIQSAAKNPDNSNKSFVLLSEGGESYCNRMFRHLSDSGKKHIVFSASFIEAADQKSSSYWFCCYNMYKPNLASPEYLYQDWPADQSELIEAFKKAQGYLNALLKEEKVDQQICISADYYDWFLKNVSKKERQNLIMYLVLAGFS